MVEEKIGNTRLIMIMGDITEQETEAVVNAANSSLLGGGGVDGAIHRAGGPQILEECKLIRKKQGKCPPGKAVITTGGDLKADYVIHTVGPVWHGGNNNEDRVLASSYRTSLQLAAANNISSLSFPSISTGAYNFPVKRAAAIALNSIKEFVENNPDSLEEIRMVLFSRKDYSAYLEVWRDIYQIN